jgi:hypothetical protein
MARDRLVLSDAQLAERTHRGLWRVVHPELRAGWSKHDLPAGVLDLLEEAENAAYQLNQRLKSVESAERRSALADAARAAADDETIRRWVAEHVVVIGIARGAPYHLAKPGATRSVCGKPIKEAGQSWPLDHAHAHQSYWVDCANCLRAFHNRGVLIGSSYRPGHEPAGCDWFTLTAGVG